MYGRYANGWRLGIRVVAVFLTICCACAAVTGCADIEGDKNEGRPAVADGQKVTQEGLARLPFAVDGVPCDAPVIEVGDCADEASLDAVWSFGGDYADIGSFPLDGKTVFGSHSDDADDVTSYDAALISQDGIRVLGCPSADALQRYEPQDGSGNADRVIWRSSPVGESAQMFSDDWRLQMWDAETGDVRTLGTAKDLDENASFQAYGDVVPTMNDKEAYFSTAIQAGDAWRAVVVSCGLSGSGLDILAEGGYPAAVDDGVLCATGLADASNLLNFSEVSLFAEAGKSTVLSVAPDDLSWRVSGIWAYGDKRAVAFNSDESAAGSYIGVWDDAFAKPVAWLHADAPSVVASMNDEWLVWGSGSQAEHAEMYAFDIDGCSVTLLGAAPGYSRPAIAQESNAVMLPVFNGPSDPVAFKVGMLL